MVPLLMTTTILRDMFEYDPRNMRVCRLYLDNSVEDF